MTICFSASLFAQDTRPQHNGQGYAYYGIDAYGGGSFGNVYSAGGGGEGFLYKGLTAGADIGYVGRYNDQEAGFGLLTTGTGYHFTNADRTSKFVPFLAGGYGLAFRNGVLNTGYYGGGATYWFHDRFGFRVELRDYQAQGGRFLTTLRFALSFR